MLYPRMNIPTVSNPEEVPSTLVHPKHAAHGALFCSLNEKIKQNRLFGTHPMRYAVLKLISWKRSSPDELWSVLEVYLKPSSRSASYNAGLTLAVIGRLIGAIIAKMQLRHDGLLGFPGGYVDRGEDITTGLNRELHEELGLPKKYYLSKGHYHKTWIHNFGSSTLVDHFYIKEFSEKEFSKIEKAVISSCEWGKETLGLVRVPLYDFKALANFFKNNFVGNARDQLVEVLIKCKIFTCDEINRVWSIVERQ